jgi:hypothetical protein
MSALALGTVPVFEEPSKRSGPRGRQPESASNDAVKDWARMRKGVLYRNRRGMFRLPEGGMLPYGLGPNGYGDNVGYLTIRITPEMLGREIAVYAMIECKRADKALKTPDDNDPQYKAIQEVRAAGGIAGYARHAGDCEDILNNWRSRG